MKKKTIAILGLGQFSSSLIEEFDNYKYNIIVIDKHEERIKRISDKYSDVYVGDASSLKVLKELNIKDADEIIISYGSLFEETILTFMNLKQLGAENIIVKCSNETYFPIYRKLGIDNIINPYEITAEVIAYKIARPEFDEYFRLTEKYCVVDFTVPSGFEGQKLIDIEMRKIYKLNLLLIKRDDTSITPGPEDSILANDVLYVFGQKQNVVKLINYFKKENN